MQTRTTTSHDIIGLTDDELAEILNALRYTNQQDMCIDPEVMEGILDHFSDLLSSSSDSGQPETNDTDVHTVTIQTKSGDPMTIPINDKFDLGRIVLGADVNIVSNGEDTYVIPTDVPFGIDFEIVAEGVVLDSSLFGRR